MVVIVYNGCHDLLMMSIDLSIIAILNIDSIHYHCVISIIKGAMKYKSSL